MPTRHSYYHLVSEEFDFGDTEYPTKAEAQAAADEKFISLGEKWQVFANDRILPSEEELAATKSVFLLTLEVCNGEYGENGHTSVHATLDSAKATQSKLLDPEDLKGEDASNEWKASEYREGEIEFCTGNWGYNVWKIQELKLLGEIK